VGGDGAAHGAAELGEEATQGAAEGVVAARGAAGGSRPSVAQLVQGPQVA